MSYSVVLRLFGNTDHVFQQDFKRHGMAATLVGQEEFTVTGKFSTIESDVVFIVIPMEGHVKLIKAEAFAVLSVAFGFFDLSDHPVVHYIISFSEGMKKARGQARAFL
jgi:hypothetical protein